MATVLGVKKLGTLGVDLSEVKEILGEMPEEWKKAIAALDRLGEEKQEEFHRRECRAMVEAQRMITGS